MKNCQLFRMAIVVAMFAAGLFVQAQVPQVPQVPGVIVSAGMLISSDNPTAPFAESFLAVNPRDPNNMIAASSAVLQGRGSCVVYASRDGGGMWRRTQTTTGIDSRYRYTGDPAVYFDAGGTAFFVLIGTASHFILSRSSDGGFTWEAPVVVPGVDYDRPYLAFDNANGKMYTGGTIQLAGSNGDGRSAIEVASSVDKGRTFSEGHVFDGGEGVFMADLLVTSTGRLVIPFTSRVSSGPVGLSTKHWWTTVSEDGGRTFLQKQEGPVVSRAASFSRIARNEGVPRATIDSSDGAYRDRIYIVWDDFDQKKYVVKVAHSSDLGKTWSKPVTVNDNRNDGEPANPAITVNKDGVVAVAFNDRRDDPHNSCYRLYYSVSFDGGETFLPNVKASEQPTCPVAPGNWSAWTFTSADLSAQQGRRPAIGIRAPAERFLNGGDTQGLAADNRGIFHSAWINGQSGVMQLWSKELSVDNIVATKSPFSTHRKDLSHDLALDVSEPSINFATHLISVKVRIHNPLSVAVSGPFTVVLDDIAYSSLRNLRAINSDNGMHERGASWRFTVAGEILQPGEKSEERLFLSDFEGDPGDDRNEPLFYAHYLILGKQE